MLLQLPFYKQVTQATNNFTIELPPQHSRRYANIHNDPVIAKIVRMAKSKDGSSIKVVIDRETARQAIGAMYAKGVRLFCSGKHRQWLLNSNKEAPAKEQDAAPGFAA